MKDVTSNNMIYILNTPYYHDEFNTHLSSMFNTEEVKDDKNLGYNTVINGLNSIKKKKIRKSTNFMSKQAF